MIDFSGKRGVVMGIANQRSIALAAAKQLHALGAEMAFTYGPDPKGRFQQYAENQAKELNATQVLPLDAREDGDIVSLFDTLDKAWGGLDFVLHSLAYADRDNLEHPFVETPREGWSLAQDVSAYSVVPITRHATPLLLKRGGGSIVAMTFIGSMLAVPGYNVMGPAKAALESAVRYLARELGPQNIRCNTISAGALKTLSSSAIKNFGTLFKIAEEHCALERNVTLEEIGNVAAFLLSDAASGITGQAIYVDGGFNIMAN